MANTLHGKWLEQKSVNGEKIELKYGEALKGKDSSGNEIELVKISAEGKVLVKNEEVAKKVDLDSQISGLAQEILDRQSGDAAAVVEAKAYADTKIAEIVNSAPAVLDTLKELADSLGNDANFATTVANQIGSVDDKVDQEILDRQSAMASEVSARQAADAQTLLDAKSYTDSAKSQLESSLSSLQSSLESQVNSAVSLANGVKSDMDDLEIYAQDIRSDLDSEIASRISADSDLSSRIGILEALPQGSQFKKMIVTVASELGFIDLLHTAKTDSIHVILGRIPVHEGEDYTLSVVGGKTRLTWAGDLLPGGIGAIATGDKLYINYAY